MQEYYSPFANHSPVHRTNSLDRRTAMSLEEVAKGLTEFCKQGKYQEATDAYYSPDIVSVEAMGPNPVCTGLAGIEGKLAWWTENVEVHAIGVDGPFINTNTDTFAVVFTMDTTMKATGVRSQGREVAIYTVKDGKIVHEQFLSGGEVSGG